MGCKESTTSNKTSRVAALPFYKEATFTPHWLDATSEAADIIHRIPSFNLINQLGEEVTEKTFKDKIYIADFFFTTCPGICPKMTANMMVLQEEFINNNDILLLSHSVTPETDSVSILKHYAETKGIIDRKWHLVTGDRKQIYDLGRQAYFAEEDLGVNKTEDDFLHTENFVLIDKNRHIRGIYNGLNKTSVQQLIADVKTLQKEN
ncbi:SCO family protein [Psychroserpens ponticola]|uniref:SCO family protein n=1 Tax=Psychroserpens ponticola TaxID=2932268 RepID=A0ABY7RV54_9FLAO|nr:SCO family protein [Psychroserpens ponticola]WCO00647.1 SCO family protein [Psychroserpens ponticola]